MSENKKTTTVDCYNCTGAKMHTMCGFPMPGCVLCETHGQGHGELFQDFSKITVQIGTETFVPPDYSCLMCKDSKVASRQIWDEDLVDDGFSDHGAHNMPQVEVACWKCCPEKADIEFKLAETNYFNKKKEHT